MITIFDNVQPDQNDTKQKHHFQKLTRQVIVSRIDPIVLLLKGSTGPTKITHQWDQPPNLGIAHCKERRGLHSEQRFTAEQSDVLWAFVQWPE